MKSSNTNGHDMNSLPGEINVAFDGQAISTIPRHKGLEHAFFTVLAAIVSTSPRYTKVINSMDFNKPRERPEGVAVFYLAIEWSKALFEETGDKSYDYCAQMFEQILTPA